MIYIYMLYFTLGQLSNTMIKIKTISEIEVAKIISRYMKDGQVLCSILKGRFCRSGILMPKDSAGSVVNSCRTVVIL